MKKSNDILITVPFCICRYQQTIRSINTSERKSSVFKSLCRSSIWEPNVVWSTRKIYLYSNFHWLHVASQIWLWKGYTQKLTIWFNPFIQWFPKFVKRKHVILLFRLLTGFSDLIRYLKQGYIVFLSKHYFSYPTCIGKANKRNLVASATQLAITLTTLLFHIWAWNRLQFL